MGVQLKKKKKKKFKTLTAPLRYAEKKKNYFFIFLEVVDYGWVPIDIGQTYGVKTIDIWLVFSPRISL